jgi:hypothetical protein
MSQNNEQQQERSRECENKSNDAEILASIRNNGNAASAENVHNQTNYSDNHPVADDPQLVGILSNGRQRLLP